MTRSILFRLPLLSLFLGIVCLTSGCGSGSGVSGNVTLDGAPVDGGTIVFVPEGGGEKAHRVPGEIKGGRYSISSPELKSGTYRVEINWLKKTGKKLANPSDPGTTIEEAKEVIADEYNRTSKLKVEIKSGSDTHNFELKSGGVITGSGKPGGGSGADAEVQPGKRP